MNSPYYVLQSNYTLGYYRLDHEPYPGIENGTTSLADALKFPDLKSAEYYLKGCNDKRDWSVKIICSYPLS